jgi:hypothetical protein
MKLPRDVKEFFRKQGKIGAKKRSANLSPQRRSEIARAAAIARWTTVKAEGNAKEGKK